MTAIKVLRLTKGLRQDDVEELSRGRIKQRRISDLERGIKPTQEEVEILANIYDVGIEKIYDELGILGIGKNPSGRIDPLQMTISG